MLTYFQARDFRCLKSVEIKLDPRFNLIFGQNASGKTSLLEAIAYLGRGRSYRGAPTEALIRGSAKEFLVFGKTVESKKTLTIGVKNGSGGLELSVNGDTKGGVASLVNAIPLQIIDPEIHNIVGGAPEKRRQYLDWVAFHVEQGYLGLWRRYKRSLKQRNAMLRSKAKHEEIRAWDKALAALGEEIDTIRQQVFVVLKPVLLKTASFLLKNPVFFDYDRGWQENKSLLDVFIANENRDSQYGTTHSGPHRADIKITHENKKAKGRVSRGEQKLLACATILSAVEVVQSTLDKKLLLLLDDPAAELDTKSLKRLMEKVFELKSQLIVTSIEPEADIFPQQPSLFHVERGKIHCAK